MRKSEQKDKKVNEVLTEHVNFRLSASEVATIDMQAKRSGKSRSEVLRCLLKKVRT